MYTLSLYSKKSKYKLFFRSCIYILTVVKYDSSILHTQTVLAIRIGKVIISNMFS